MKTKIKILKTFLLIGIITFQNLFFIPVSQATEPAIPPIIITEIAAFEPSNYEWIEIYKADGIKLPPATAGKKYSGRFNIRLGAALHERLAIESLKENESLNSYCVKVLKDEVGL